MKLCLGIFALNLLLFPFDLAQAGNCTHHLHQVGELDEWKAWVKSLENNSSFLKAERKDRRWLEKWAKSTGSLARTSETWSGSLEVRRSDEILTAFRNARGSIVQIGNYISGLN
ncbi:MAG: hypothetical protein KDD35_07375, partial [Bdellovibrionales bacterium]|nr:hypothetical protein [Bdellovibrionales bacterium]